MGRLNKVIKDLEAIYWRAREVKNYEKPMNRTKVRQLIKENDSTLLEKKAAYATTIPKHHRRRADKIDAIIRKATPGFYDVVFINKHTKEKNLLTLEIGVYYDMALNYLNYITDYQTETHNELGHYEIAPHEKAFLPEDPHTGL